MAGFQRVCVYCGSSRGADPAYALAARSLGAHLAASGIELVYGGGSVGLMNEVAEGALRGGGRVVGVIPEKLLGLELGRRDLTELVVVPDMHARKKAMADRADAFLALPGGYGTLEELFEAVTWTQLNYHRKPLGLLNVSGYYDALVAFLARAVSDGFVRELHAGLIVVDHDAVRLLDRMAHADLPELSRWIDDV